jgi:hypothetical protein
MSETKVDFKETKGDSSKVKRHPTVYVVSKYRPSSPSPNKYEFKAIALLERDVTPCVLANGIALDESFLKQPVVLDDTDADNADAMRDLLDRKFLYAVVQSDLFLTLDYMIVGVAATREGARVIRDRHDKEIKDMVAAGKISDTAAFHVQFRVVESKVHRSQPLFVENQEEGFDPDDEVPNYDDRRASAMIAAAIRDCEVIRGAAIVEKPESGRVSHVWRMSGNGCSRYYVCQRTGNTMTIWWCADPGMISGGRSVENGAGPYYYRTFEQLSDAIRHSLDRDNDVRDGDDPDDDGEVIEESTTPPKASRLLSRRRSRFELPPHGWRKVMHTGSKKTLLRRQTRQRQLAHRAAFH